MPFPTQTDVPRIWQPPPTQLTWLTHRRKQPTKQGARRLKAQRQRALPKPKRKKILFLSFQSQAPVTAKTSGGKSEAEIKEEEELQLALALSQSEAEESEKLRKKRENSPFYSSTAGKESNETTKNPAIDQVREISHSYAFTEYMYYYFDWIFSRKLQRVVSLTLSWCDICKGTIGSKRRRPG